jgi:uncharacterized repeat protein (TIGR04076 family)
MAERHEVKVTVLTQKGHCAWGHKVGDSWIIGGVTPPGMCLSMLHSLFPAIRGIMYGAEMGHGTEPGVTTIACPDAENPMTFEIRRLPTLIKPL